jgi:hypothetical protein
VKSGKQRFGGDLQNVDSLKSFVTQHSGFIFPSNPVPSSSEAKVWKKPAIVTEIFAHALINKEKAFGGAGSFEKMAKSCSGVLFIDEVHKLEPLKSEFGSAITQAMMQIMEDHQMRKQLSIIVAGYPKEVDESFLAFDPGLLDRFPEANRLHFRDFNDDELSAIFERYVNSTLHRKIDQTPLQIPNGDGTFTDSKSIEFIVGRKLGRMRGPDPSKGEPCTKGFSNARRVENFADECVRRAKMRIGLKSADVLTRADVLGQKIDIAKCEAIAELRSMVGLDEVKRKVDQLVTTANLNMDREAAGQAIQDFKLHKVFHGNPGLLRLLFDGRNSCSSY